MLKVLVADDESGIREILNEILKAEGHLVTEAADGAEAREILMGGDFDVIISDMQMPKMSGIELLQWAKANKPLPFLLITGFSNLFETKQAFELGANGFLTKPFNRKDIREALVRLFENAAEEENERQYCRIPIEDFVSSAGFQINVYAKLSESKFVRVAHKGDLIPNERIETYQKKGVNFLYAKKEEFSKVVGFNIELSNCISSSKGISQAKKLRFLKYTSELVLENCFVNGLDPKTFQQASQCLEICLSVVSENERVFETIELLNRHSNWLYAHSIGVAIYSVMIGRKLGFKGQSTLFKLAVAGLLHDIGSKELPEELLLKARGAMTADERSLFETHPTRSKELLQNCGLSEDLLQVIYEHHEEGMGQGYPRRVIKSKIHPLVRIVSLADRFCYLVLKSPGTGPDRSMSPGAAITTIVSNSADAFEPKEIDALKAICATPVTLEKSS